MNFLLKIVEGPNRGAEIALVEGVAVTLGKADACDIVLADATLGDEPLEIAASADGVTFDGERLEPFHVTVRGSTAFAVGPADGAWGELVWPQAEKTPVAEEHEAADTGREAADTASADSPPPAEEPAPEEAPKRRHGCLGCLLWLIALLLILLGLVWFFRDQLRPKAEALWGRLTGKTAISTADESGGQDGGSSATASRADSLAALVAKYGLSLTNDAGRTTLSGNFRTRAERLAATAEAYAGQPGVELDLSDDESFRTAAADALFTLTEGALKVLVATNRVLSITGSSPSAAALKKTLDALNDDLPRLRDVDVTGVTLGSGSIAVTSDDSEVVSEPSMPMVRKPRSVKREPQFPVCGILVTPYPCLVMQNGTRVLEGATIGDSTILKITADSVVVTNASGRFTWKP